MTALFDKFLYEPILQTLLFIYNTIAFNNLGYAIIIFTVLVRVVLFPLFLHGAKTQALMQKIHPKIKEIQEKNKNDKAQQGALLMNLYKDHKVNPLSSLLVLIIQLPIVIAVYHVITKEVTRGVFDNVIFLGFINLEAKNVALAALTAVLQYFQTKQAMSKSLPQKSNDPAQMAGRMMLFMGPGIIFVTLMNLPSALGLYWIVTTVLSIIQQEVVNRRILERDALLKTNP